ncbi:MAG: class I SAM-dependent methyltransferase [Thermoplasmata archaeon]
MTRLDEREIRETVRQTFEAIANHFDRTRYRPWPETIAFVDSLPPQSRVLDIGCGNGRNSLLLGREGHKVIGVDFSLNLLRIAKDKMTRKSLGEVSQFLGGDASVLPLKENEFDAALYIATLHHIPTQDERLKSLKELRRCLKPIGTALISVWAIDQPKFEELLEKRKEDPDYADTFLPWTRTDGKVFQRYYHLFEEEELRELVKKSGLQMENYFKSSDNYFARVRKSA